MIAATLVRLRPADRAGGALASYMAVPSSRAAELVTRAPLEARHVPAYAEFGAVTVEVMPWRLMPAVERLAAARLAAAYAGGQPPFWLVGTVEEGRWCSWYPPVAQPPVPGMELH